MRHYCLGNAEGRGYCTAAAFYKFTDGNIDLLWIMCVPCMETEPAEINQPMFVNRLMGVISVHLARVYPSTVVAQTSGEQSSACHTHDTNSQF